MSTYYEIHYRGYLVRVYIYYSLYFVQQLNNALIDLYTSKTFFISLFRWRNIYIYSVVFKYNQVDFGKRTFLTYFKALLRSSKKRFFFFTPPPIIRDDSNTIYIYIPKSLA